MNKKNVISNFTWRLLERFGAQGVTLIVSIVLARLLDPKTYGTVAIVTVFITLLQVFVDSGLGNALIQKKDADDIDFASVFFFNIVMCLVLYLLLWTLAPRIADFYDNPQLVALIRVLGVVIIISGVKNVQQAYISRNLLFKKFFFATLGGTLIAAIIGIAMAYCGFGAWSIVFQMIINSLVDTVILWITVKWRPKVVFSFSRLCGLLSYGWKLLVSSLVDTGYNKVRELIIGKTYNSESLALYNRGEQLPSNIVIAICTAIDSVLLPTMAQQQDDVASVKSMTRRAIKTSSYCITPMMIGLGVCADTLIPLLLTDKWIECVPFLRVFCFTYALYPIHTANLNAIKAIGRSDLFLKLEIVKKTIGILALIIAVKFGALAIACSCLVAGLISQIINSWPNRKLLNYGYFEQLLDIIPTIIISLIMGGVVYLLGGLPYSNFVVLFIQVLSGIVLYVLLSIIFKIDSFKYIISIFKKEK